MPRSYAASPPNSHSEGMVLKQDVNLHSFSLEDCLSTVF